MSKIMDNLTLTIKIATDILFVSNPRGTSLGIMFGIFLEGLIGLIAPGIESLKSLNIEKLKTYHYIALGIFAFNFKSYINRHKTSPKIEEAIKTIDELHKNGKISDLDAKTRYKKLVDKAVDDIVLARGEAEKVQKITDRI